MFAPQARLVSFRRRRNLVAARAVVSVPPRFIASLGMTRFRLGSGFGPRRSRWAVGIRRRPKRRVIGLIALSAAAAVVAAVLGDVAFVGATDAGDGDVGAAEAGSDRLTAR